MAISTPSSAISRFLFGQPVVHDSAMTARHLTVLVARIALSAIFLTAGFAKLSDPSGAVSFMNQKGVPDADTLVYVAGTAEILGGLAILFGFLTRIGALGLIAFLVVTNFYFHNFWDLAGTARRTEMVQFMKDLCIAGGLLLIASSGAGRYSLDAIVRGGGPIAHDFKEPALLTHGVPVRHAVPVRPGI
jgi:putative oxidoreductase